MVHTDAMNETRSPQSNFQRLRWWFFALAIGAVFWAMGIESTRPSPGACASITGITGTTPADCGTPPALGYAVAAAVIFGLLWLIAMLARKS